MKDTKKKTKKNIFSEQQIAEILDALDGMYPEAECELDFKDKFQLIIAVVLSAQTTDKSVNKVTPALFEKYPDAFALAKAGERAAEARRLDAAALSADEIEALAVEDISEIIRRIGMYKTKSKNIYNLARGLVAEHGGTVPEDYDKLVALPGVGRKTANVVLAVGFGHQRIAVDTHVFRVANRIGLADEKDVLKTEYALMEVLPEDRWSRAHHSLIFHGRYCCDARKPKCEECAVSAYCKYYKK